MTKTRQTLLNEIQSLQQLIPGENYAMYIKQCGHKHLQFVSPVGFLPAMDENRPATLNDVELNVLSMARKNYLENVFMPVIVEKQIKALKLGPHESDKDTIARWMDLIITAQSPDKLIKIIEDVNRRRGPSEKSGASSKKSFWKKMLGL